MIGCTLYQFYYPPRDIFALNTEKYRPGPGFTKGLKQKIVITLTGFQSAYTRFHSTESALLNIQDDLFLNMSEGSTTALTLLDLSAAFDTIDHSILFHRLHECYGINGLALSWFESYLSDRTQSVKVLSVLSHPMDLKFGVPQGSVLGPLLFSMYRNPLSAIIQSHRGIKHHFYADDTQLYITLSPSNFSQSMTALTDCLNDIQNFMVQINSN